MSFAHALVRRPGLAALAGLALFAAACSGGEVSKGTLAITSPVEGATITLADDLLPDVPGVQLEAVVTATNLEGAVVSLSVPGATAAAPTAAVKDGVARITFTAAATGAIVATASDAAGNKVESAGIHVTFDPAPQACRFVVPADKATLAASDDASPTDGFQAKVQVRCAGVELGNSVKLRVGGSAYAEAVLGPGGLAVFAAVELAEGENQLEAETKTNAGTQVKAAATVTVKTGGCRVLVAPPTGTVFNARGEGTHANVVADRTPGSPMDAVLVVTTGAECNGATLTVKKGQTPLATAKIGSTTMELPLELPDGLAELRAYVSGSISGVSPLVRYTVDSVLPTATLTFPAGGETFNDAQDRSQAPGLQIPVRGKFTGIGAGKPFEVVLEPGTAQESVQRGVLAADESFDLLVTLANGSHGLLVRAARDSGTTAKTPTVSFTSVYVGASLAITAPGDGEKFPLSRDADPAADGYQVKFSIAGTNLSGASGELHCGLAVAPFSLGSDGTAQVTVTFAGLGCDGALVACDAHLVTSEGVAFTSAKANLRIDPTPPEVQLLNPSPDAIVPSNVVPVTATTSCAGETQQAAILSGAVEVVAGPVAQNAISFADLTLPGGESALVLRVTDAAGNETSVPFRVFVDADAPQPTFESPSGADVTFGPSDDEQGDLNDGLQRTVVIAVENESEGTLVELKVNDRAAVSARTARNGQNRLVATFTGVSLPEGDSTLRACATDDAGSVGCTTQAVKVVTGRPSCAIASPQDGSALGHRDDLDAARDGVQADVLVETSAPVGSLVQLQLGGAGGSSTVQAAVEAGTPNVARFVHTDFAVEGSYTLQATCTGEDNLTGTSLVNTVRVDFTAPTIEITDPIADQVFNLASADRGAAAGFQVDVRVHASEPAAGDLVKLTVSCGQGPIEIPAVAVNTQQEAVFRAVPLPDEGQCDFTVQLEDGAGNLSPAVTSHARVDRVAPTVTITAPNGGSLFGAAKDANPSTAGFELDKVTARIDGVAPTSIPTLKIGTTAGPTGAFSAIGANALAGTWALVPLAEGSSELAVAATDDAGNTTTARVTVTVDTHGPVVTITNFVNGQVLNRATDRDGAKAGLQQNVNLAGEKLVTGTTVRVCSPQATTGTACATGNGKALGETVLGGGSASVPGVTFPEGAVSLYAEAVDLAGNTASSAILNVVVDSVGPVVNSLALAKYAGATETVLDTKNGTAVFGQADDSGAAAGFQVRLRAKIAGVEAGKGLTAQFFTSNPVAGTFVGQAPLADDGTVVFDATLSEGGHRLYVLARDVAGNATSTPDAPVAGETPVSLGFGIDVTPPTLAILAPSAGKLLAAADKDKTTPGLQYDVEVDSDAGAGAAFALTLDATAFATGTLPTTGTKGTVRVTIPEGPHQLAASTKDAAGNAASTAPVSVNVDSVAPVVAITAPAAGTTISTDGDPAADGFQIGVTVTYGQVETGRTLVLASSTGGTLATAATDGTGTVTFSGVTVPSGAQALTVTVSDVSGNETTSAPVSITIDTNAPSIRFATSANPIYFGLADGTSTDGTKCTPTIQASCDTNGATAVLLVNGTAGTEQTVATNAASFTGLSIPAGQTVTLQLKATDGTGRIGYSASRQATCDLTVPGVSVQSPAGAGAKFVAFGNPGGVPGAIADKAPGAPLEADLSVLVTGANGGTVSVKSSLDGTLATQAVTSDPFTATFTSVGFPSTGRHVVTVTASGRSRNTKDATLTFDVDVVPPNAANAAAAVVPATRTNVKLTFPAPADDAGTGAKVSAYLVKRADAAIDDATKWANATLVAPTNLVIANAGATQEVNVTGLAFEKQHFFAVRAVDAAGNLGPLGTSPSADLRASRQHFAAPTTGGSATSARAVFVDLDADGKDDLVTSSAALNANQGQVSIVYGAATPGSPVTLTTAGTNRFGWTLATGDVNGDGVQDLLVGAPFTPNPSRSGAQAAARDGAVHVFLGKRGVRLSSNAAADAVIYGNVTTPDDPNTVGAGMGYELVTADVNGDGLADVVAAAPFENAQKGRIRFFAGRATWPSVVNATDAFADMTTAVSYAGGPRLGLRLANLGDLDGDGKAEVAAGAPTGTPSASGPGLRPVYVIAGRLVTGTALFAEQTSAAVYANDASTVVATNHFFGGEVIAEDVTGDGKLDLIAQDLTGGRIAIFSGALLAPFIPKTAAAAADASAARIGAFVATNGTANYESAGGANPYLKALGDVTGDGIADFAISRSGTATTNDLGVIYGRSATAWGSYAGGVPDALVVRTDTTAEFVNFGVRAAAGKFYGGATRDLAILDLGGAVTVLAGP